MGPSDDVLDRGFGVRWSRLVLAGTFLLAASPIVSAATGIPTSVALPPVTVKLPAPGGWEMLRNNGSNLVMKRDDGTVAYANVGRWPPPKSQEEFLSGVRRDVHQMASSLPNATMVDESYSATSDRPYPCLRANFHARVTLTMAEHGRDGIFKIHYRILACHSLDKLMHAFLAAYSYPGETQDRTRESEAESFLKGVTTAGKQPSRKP